MSTIIKIHGGTGKSTGKPLCFSCSHAIIRGDMDIRCYYGGESIVINKPIFNCNVYHNADMPSIHDMRETAWKLRTEKDGRTIGFAPPRKDSNPRPSWMDDDDD